MTDRPGTAETPLIAGPPPANPPLLVALLIVVLSLTAPVLFLRAGRPSLWLTSAILALAFAGIVAFVSAIEAQAKRRADHAIRARAIISPSGITFLPTPTRPASRYFSAQHVKHASLLDGALIVTATDLHPSPGRHVLRFGQLACPRAQILDAIATLMSSK